MKFHENDIIAEHYRLTKHLGNGSFGDVWLAHNLLADIDVAIKFYGAMDSHGMEEFRHEFKLTYKLNHPNLLNINHFDVFQDCPYLVMPYCSNGSLASRRGRMNENEAWHMLADVSNGLKFLHRLQPPIIHQDIKPDNILLTDDGRYVISDFGISKSLRQRLTGTALNPKGMEGTLAYMAPERLAETPVVVLASDIWALGMTLYEMLTGELLWEGMGGISQLHHVNGAPNIHIPNVSDKLCNIIACCLHAEPWKRPEAKALYEQAEKMGREDDRLIYDYQPQPQPIPKPKPIPEPIPIPEPKPSHAHLGKSENSSSFLKSRHLLTAAAMICLAGAIIWGGVTFLNRTDIEQEYNMCVKENTIEGYEAFIQKYPQSSWAKLVQRRLDILQSNESPSAEPVPTPNAHPAASNDSPSPAIEKVVIVPSPQKAAQPVQQNQANKPADKRPHQEFTRDDAVFNRCHTLNDYEAYLREYPNGKHKNDAQTIITILRTEQAKLKQQQQVPTPGVKVERRKTKSYDFE